MTLRAANIGDLDKILDLINNQSDTLLRRTLEEVSSRLGTMWVVEENGEVVGCCMLEVYSQKIAEVRSLVVKEEYRHRGYGGALVKAAVQEAERRKIHEILVVTSAVKFFEGLSFGPSINEEKYALFYKGSK